MLPAFFSSENNPEAADEMELVIPAAEAASDNGDGVGATPVPPPLREQMADAEAIEQRSMAVAAATAAARSRSMAVAKPNAVLVSAPEGSDEPRVERKGKRHQLVWLPDQEAAAGIGRGKYKQIGSRRTTR